ncbi:MAG: LysM peptidoglycan-binding domain-containing protein, partial [Chloroflexota bacterium]
ATPSVIATPTAIAASPTPAPTATPTPAAGVTATPAQAATAAATYTVQPGDTLFLLAQKLHVSLAALEQVNGIVNPDVIASGQVLRLPPVTPTP